MEERANENREMTVVFSYVKQRAASAFMLFKRITKENGSLYKSTKERVKSKKLMEMGAPYDGLLTQGITSDSLVTRVLSLPPSRKCPGCGLSRVYVDKSDPH